MKRKTKTIGETALYERLSRDDDNGGDSNSIVHQKEMLEDYAQKNGFANFVHYTDDGWSGATFDRPAWNKLIEGVKSGKITTVIVKDLSRVGRDHLQVGFFTDILFREKEIRFIAIGNGVDSLNEQSSEFAPFLNIMNEWYVRDTSKKIKSVLRARGTNGKAHTSNNPPYGYLKDPDNPNHWIIDEEAAPIVKRIFQLCIEGNGPHTIARILSKEKVVRPSNYLAEKGLGNHQTNVNPEGRYNWIGTTVTGLLKRREYYGCTVNFRTYKNSYKDKRVKYTEEEDLVIFEGTQEPIIDKETWEIVQKLRKTVRKAKWFGTQNPLTGKVFGVDCGAPMYNHWSKNPRKRYYYNARGEKRYYTR
ncbi:MAG: recombinase family protein [Peptoniphilaceae bacterium]|nr:recombinase family protein [Peptoniphilaceae bacterium]MDY3075571.1 recombinase family protein [Peptoniphilaceae bacterium]